MIKRVFGVISILSLFYLTFSLQSDSTIPAQEIATSKNIAVNAAQEFTIDGTDEDDIIKGTDDNNIFKGGLGNDTIFGGLSDDTFIYNEGDGNDIITLRSGKDKIVLGNMLPSDIDKIQMKRETLKISFKDPPGSITVADYGLNKKSKALTIEFSDGSFWDNNTINRMISN